MFEIDYEKILRKFIREHKEIGRTLELVNFKVSYDKVKQYDIPDQKNDVKERQWLLKEIDKAIDLINNEKFTRKAIIYNSFPGKLDHNCTNVFHLYFRENKLNLNVYARSINYDGNFEYDLSTFLMLLEKSCKKLKLKKGLVNLQIMSLHANL